MSAKRRFLSFCSTHNIPPVPIAESSLCLYASYLARQGLRHQTIRTYLSAVRHYYITQGFPDVFADNQFPRLQYVLKGVHRAEGPSDSSDKRLPITPTILGTLLEVWSVNDKDRFESSMLWAACCLGFFAFLRAGEFISTTTEVSFLRPMDISIDCHSNPSYMKVHLQKSKTDPFGKGVDLFVGRTFQQICPVAAVLSFLAMRPPCAGPLFIHSNSQRAS